MIIQILIVIILSAFFSGMEIAYISANKFQAELDAKLNKLSASIVSRLLKTPSQYISTMLIGNNIMLVLYSMIMANLLNPILYGYIHSDIFVLVSETIIATFIILIFAEYLPKVIFVSHPNLFMRIFAIPVYLFYYILYPLAKFTIFLSNLLLKIMGFSQENNSNNFTFGKIDLDHFLEEVKENPSDKNELNYFKKALDLSEIKIRECAVPRTEIVAIEINKPVEKLRQLFIESGFSKILVYENNIDNIIGYVHVLDIFKHPQTIKSILRTLLYVPETLSAQDLLTEFINKQKSIAVVIDEFGGTAGIVTIEDLLEEFIGEIEDEYDDPEYIEKKISNNKYLFSGRLEIDYLNEKYLFGLPRSEEYETLAGFILEHHNDIPKPNEEIIIDNFKFKILSSTKKKIDKVEMEILPQEKNTKDNG